MLSTGPHSYQSQVILFIVDKTALLYLLVNEIFAVRNLILYQLKQFQGKKAYFTLQHAMSTLSAPNKNRILRNF